MEGFSGLAIILGLAAMGGWIAKALKQPVILGYILAGIAVSGWVSRWIEVSSLISVMGEVGVTLLLFLVGMELPITELKRVGRVALVTGVGQILISATIGYLAARLLGWGSITAIYVGLGLSFGSTILMVKLLSEMGDLQSLPGKIAVGYLLVQDFVAVGVLVMLSGAATGNLNPKELVWVILKAVALVSASLFISKKVVEKALNFVNQSTELLFISALGWCLVVAAIVGSKMIGFTAEIGGFLAGLTLAGAAEQAQIVARVRPVRDFFMTWFFVTLGAGVNLSLISGMIFPAMVLAAGVTFINPTIVILMLTAQGLGKRVAFLSSLATTSVSEFSLIVAAVAVRSGLAPESLIALLTLVALVTMVGESYIVTHSHKIYRKLAPILGKSGGGRINMPEDSPILKDHMVLFGHNRIGGVIRPVLEKLGELIVVDFNPEVVEQLVGEGIKVIYGDMSDHEMYDQLGLREARLVVSTVPDIEDSLRFLGEIKSWKRRPVVILTAADNMSAGRLYKSGANYVLVPHSVGGEYVADVLYRNKDDFEKKISELGTKHRERLARQ